MPMIARDLVSRDPHLSLMVYGFPGAGKTTWGAKAPRPLILLTEQQGVPSVLAANPEALVEVVTSYRHLCCALRSLKRGAPVTLDNGQGALRITYPLEEDARDLSAILKSKQTPTEYDIQTVVMDSLTDIHNKIVKAYPGKKDDEVNWGRVQRDMSQMLDDLRSLPVNVIALALAEEGQDEQKRYHTKPALFGRLGQQAGQFFSGVGFARKSARVNEETGESKNVYGIAWELPSRYQTKRPPCAHGFPEYTIGATLGDMLLHIYGGVEATACNPEDSADNVK